MRAAILTLADARTPEPSLEELLEAVALLTHIPRKELMGRRRWASYCRARHIFFHAARRLTSHKMETIGTFMGRDHSTVSHGCQMVDEDPQRFEPELSRVMAQFQNLAVAA